jgi:uncharacterized protein YgfB (UPF0149 family)
MSTDSNSTIIMPDFDQLADVYWRLGVIQAPSQLQGFVVGVLAVGDTWDEQQWLNHAASFLDPVEPPNAEDRQLFLALYVAAQEQLSSSDVVLNLLLPDDGVEIGLRIDCIGQWCKGFMAGFAQGGKSVKTKQGQQYYSEQVSEALSDIASISQIDVSDDDSDESQREQNVFEICEYLRVAAMTIYLDCRQPVAEAKAATVKTQAESAVGSISNLFNKGDNQLH